MTVRGKWRILGSSPRTEMPHYEADDPDMMGPAYIFFDAKGGGEFAFIARRQKTSSTAC